MQSKVAELTSSLMKMEFEKKDLQFSLDRRAKDYKVACDEVERMKSTVQSQKQQLEDATQTIADLTASLSTMRNQIVSLFISFSQFLDVDCAKEEELKPALYTIAREAFPAKSEPTSQESNLEMVVLGAVDHVSLLKTRLHACEDEVAAKATLLASQAKQISDLEEVNKNDQSLIARLQSTVTSLKTSQPASAASEAVETAEQVKELERSNTALREAMRSMQETLHEQQKRVEESESRAMALQKELVGIQKSSNDSVHQMFAATEEKTKQLTEEKERLRLAAETASLEASSLRELLEQTRKEYEQELTVLQEKKYNVEEQVTVSERFLALSNQNHREELNRLMIAQQEAQKETEEMKILLMEKEEELRASADNCEALREQSRGQIGELTKQVGELKAQLAEEKKKAEERRAELEASEKTMEAMVATRVQTMQQKEKESARQQQRNYEEEVGEEGESEV